MTRLLKRLCVLTAIAAASLPGAALAHGGWHGGGFHHGFHGGFRGHVFLGFGGLWGPGVYGPPYYYYPPAYYPPPVAPYYTPAPAYAAPSGNCRQFNGDARIDASGQPFYGTACLGADGRWHITP